MKVEVKKVEELVHEVVIEIGPDLVNERLEARFAEVRKKAKADGYRPGKVPMNQIKEQFGEEVRYHVSDEVIKATLPDALSDKELRIASAPSITDLNYTDEGGINYTARVEVFPEIDSINTDGLKITTFELEVADEEVDAAAQQLRKSYADYREVDRPAQAGDLVTADLKKIFDPKMVVPEDGFPGSMIDLSSPQTIKEFKEQIPGMKAGDEKEIEVNYDPDYPDKNFAGAQLKYLVKVGAVQEQLLPEFDDTLAKTTGAAETALELRMKIRKDLQQQKERELQRHQKGEIIRQLCHKNDIPIPLGLVNEYLGAMVEDARQQNPDLDEAEVRNAYQGVAVNTLRWSLLFNEIARREKVEVLPSDTEQVIKGMAQQYRITEEEANEMLQKTGRAKSIRDTLMEEKVVDLLKSKAEIVKVDQTGQNKDS